MRRGRRPALSRRCVPEPARGLGSSEGASAAERGGKGNKTPQGAPGEPNLQGYIKNACLVAGDNASLC